MDDIALLAAFQKGAAHAENAVFKKYFRPLCLYSERITGYLEQSEDIVAEAFEKVIDRRNEFQTLDNLKAFLYRVVRNASINFTIAEKQHQQAHANIRYSIGQSYESEDVHKNEILRVELLQEIYEEIENLPEKCGQIFKMIFLQGLSTDQIASCLSINVQTVRTQKARAIQPIKTKLLRKNRALLAIFILMMIEDWVTLP